MDTSNVARETGTSIYHPTENDVLSGRGKFTLRWKGNIYFRTLVDHYKAEYLKGDNFKKKIIAQTIIDTIHALNPPGRFLKCDTDKNTWYDIGNRAALRKIRQALREGSITSIDTSSGGKDIKDDEILQGKEVMYDSDALNQSSVEYCSDDINSDMLKKSILNRKENNSGCQSENTEIIGSEELEQREKDTSKMDETDEWAFLGESENLSEFNPKDVFSSSDDTIDASQLSKDLDNSTNNPNDEKVEHFCSHSSQSSSKNH